MNNVTRYALGFTVASLLVHVLANAWWRLGLVGLLVAGASVLYEKVLDKLIS